ncbi:hypothetical protein DP939_21185 [Spongiactinospora rosea]|uniref:DUF3558 domain-containing protein n=1 Tax=Spongiactinospora rosea TaxID=2248750 RepID=A0A366LX78_9ACTN|nr:hypothetical protein [Spongiactinospora rosea]RBQ18377.1 hypothetical protein DP939_21185 [Spongiactinospora rosea]
MHRHTPRDGLPAMPPGESKGPPPEQPVARSHGTQPTIDGSKRTGVLVPRPIVVLTVLLMVAMAAAIGVLGAPYLRGERPMAVATPTPTPAASGAKGRFAEVPRACGLLSDALVAELLPSSRTSQVSELQCEWRAALESGKPSNGKYDMVLRLVKYEQEATGVAKAKEYFSGKRDDFVRNGQINTPAPAPPVALSGLGDESFGYTKPMTIGMFGDSVRRTVLCRISNLVVEIEYERSGTKEDKDGRLAAGAEKAARAIVAELNARG